MYRYLSLFNDPDSVLYTLQARFNSYDRPVNRYALPVHLADTSFRQVSVIEFSVIVLLTYR